MLDRETNTLTTVATTDSGWDGPSVSADGRFVGFASWATDLVPYDTNGKRDVFVYDRLTHEMTPAQVLAADGTQGNGDSAQASVSADGRFVAFASDAANLVPGDTNADARMFCVRPAEPQCHSY